MNVHWLEMYMCSQCATVHLIQVVVLRALSSAQTSSGIFETASQKHGSKPLLLQVTVGIKHYAMMHKASGVGLR